MPVNPSGGITMAEIATEIGISTSSISMANLRAQSNAYTSGTANHTGVNTTNNVLVAPDTMAEWANYTHAEAITGITYGVRLSTAEATWGLKQNSTDDQVGDTANADGGLVIWRTHDSNNTYIKAKAVFPGGTPQTTRLYYNSGNQTLTTAASGQTLITVPHGTTSLPSGYTISATLTSLDGTVVTKAHGTISGTGAALLIARGAEAAEADPGSDEEFEVKFKVELTASGTGYTTTALNNGTSNAGIICHSHNAAAADEE